MNGYNVFGYGITNNDLDKIKNSSILEFMKKEDPDYYKAFMEDAGGDDAEDALDNEESRVTGENGALAAVANIMSEKTGYNIGFYADDRNNIALMYPDEKPGKTVKTVPSENDLNEAFRTWISDEFKIECNIKRIKLTYYDT